MTAFHRIQGELYCEKVPVSQIAKKVGTPFYLYSHEAFTGRYLEMKKALSKLKPVICFSVKANPNLAVLRSLVKKGAGMDIVSGGELERALKAGCPARKIVFAGVGKKESEIKQAVQAGILLFNVESLPELELINLVAKKLKKKVDVSLRVNPDVDAGTHKHITTGKKENKFGIDLETAFDAFTHAEKYAFLNVGGVHVHIGSQITTIKPFIEAVSKVMKFIAKLERAGVEISFLNLGGGLGVVYKDEKPIQVTQFARELTRLLKGTRFGNGKGTLVFEPGRFISANSGIFVTKVQYKKVTDTKNFLIVDGAMNDLMRPSLYDAYHEIVPVAKPRNKKTVTDVVGPICESGDYFAKARLMPQIEADELIAIMSAGAYGFSMSSTYNTRPRVAETLVKGKAFDVVRKRETVADLLSYEKIPGYLK